MDRAYASGASGSAPTPPTSPSIGYPKSGNPATATPATKPGEWWYHMITEEILAVIVAAGITPDHEELNQLSQAIAALVYVPDATETVKGKVELATDLDAQGFAAGKVIDGAKLAAAFTGTNHSFLASGYQKMPGGLIVQWGVWTSSGTSGNPVSVTFPISFPSARLSLTSMVYAASATIQSAWCDSPTNSGFNGRATATGVACNYVAIGY